MCSTDHVEFAGYYEHSPQNALQSIRKSHGYLSGEV